MQRALEELQGVHHVEFHNEPDRYIVEYDPAQVSYADFERTFKHEVVGRMFRGMLDRFGGQDTST